MVFAIFLTICNMLIPAIMLGFGLMFEKTSPGKINYFYGYRTRRSMQNEDTWKFAHFYCGRLWKKIGFILLPLSVIASLPMFWMQSEDGQGILTCVIEGIQIILLIGSIFPVERALKLNFDEQGNRRTTNEE